MAKSEDDLTKEAERLLASANMPADNSIDGGIVAFHEMFTSMKKAGFTRLESLWVIGYMLTQGSTRLEAPE